MRHAFRFILITLVGVAAYEAVGGGGNNCYCNAIAHVLIAFALGIIGLLADKPPRDPPSTPPADAGPDLLPFRRNNFRPA